MRNTKERMSITGRRKSYARESHHRLSMVNNQELRRQKARDLRSIASAEGAAKARANCELACGVLKQARAVLSDPSFIELIVCFDIKSIPRCLSSSSEKTLDCAAVRTSRASTDQLGNVALEFGVAWRFFYPLLSSTQIRTHLDTEWPTFVPSLKDAFIALVMDGPFPEAIRGGRARKRINAYRRSHPRISNGSAA